MSKLGKITRQSRDIELLKDAQHQMIFNAGRSMRYHDRRSHFFDFLNKFVVFLTLLFSSATIASLFKNHETMAVWFAILSTAVNAMSLIGDFAIRARLHFDFKRQWYDLLFDIESADLNEENIFEIEKRYQQIEREEPPVMYWLNEMCYIEQGKAMGYTQQDFEDFGVTPIPWYYRITAHFHNFNAEQFKNIQPQ